MSKIKLKIMLADFLSIFIKENDVHKMLGFYSHDDEPVCCHYCGSKHLHYRGRKYRKGRMISAKCYCDFCEKKLGVMKYNEWTIVEE